MAKILFRSHTRKWPHIHRPRIIYGHSAPTDPAAQKSVFHSKTLYIEASVYITIRGLPFTTYALRGEGELKLNSAYDSTDRLREMLTRGREGVKVPKTLHTYHGSPLSINAALGSF